MCHCNLWLIMNLQKISSNLCCSKKLWIPTLGAHAGLAGFFVVNGRGENLPPYPFLVALSGSHDQQRFWVHFQQPAAGLPPRSPWSQVQLPGLVSGQPRTHRISLAASLASNSGLVATCPACKPELVPIRRFMATAAASRTPSAIKQGVTGLHAHLVGSSSSNAQHPSTESRHGHGLAHAPRHGFAF